jgi:molybdopterin converting factor small subunit
MKEIEVRLYSSLRKYQPDPASSDPVIISLDDKAKLGNLFNKLGIPKKIVAIIMVNGKSEEEGYLLQDGDRISLFPLIGGG